MMNIGKTPASVIIAVIILAIMIVGSIRIIIHPYEPVGPVLKRGFLAQNRVPLVILVVNSAVLLSILFRTSWARWISGIVFAMWSILLFFAGLFSNKLMGAVFALAGALLFLAYSLAFGPASRKFFDPAHDPVSSGSQSQTQVISGQQSADTWKCPQCDEELEAQFDSCWNCGATKVTE